MSTVSLLLSVDGVTVDYDGFKALDTFSMTLDEGEIRVVIGPNGAGKSTLCDAIIGRVRPSAGRVLFRGQDLSKLAEHRIAALGICRKFQAPGILPTLTVADNLGIAAAVDKRWWRSFGFGTPAAERGRIDAILERIGLAERRRVLAGTLAHGEKQWLEIGMVVATGAQLLLLDEPTAGMGPAETARTAELIRGLAGEHSIIVIDHDMAFVEQLAARVTVMHQGQFLMQGSIAEVRADARVADVYLGRSG